MNDSVSDGEKIITDYLCYFQEGFRVYSSIPYQDRMSLAFDFANIRAPEGASALRAYHNSVEMSSVSAVFGPVTPLELLGQQLQKELGGLTCIKRALAIHERKIRQREAIRRIKECSQSLMRISDELLPLFSGVNKGHQ